MGDFEQDLLQDAADDARTVEFIKNYLPQDVKGKFTDDELYYFLDVIVDYYATSGVLENSQPDEDGFIDIDLDEVVKYVVEQAHKDKIGDFDPEDVLWVVQGEAEFSDSLDEEE